jgi:hypothetical protein
LLRGRSGAATLNLARGCRILASGAHGCELGWAGGLETRSCGALDLGAPIREALLAE